MKNRARFFYNGILLTLVALAVRSVSLGLNSLTAGKIGAEGIGLFTLIGTVYAFAVTFATSGISLSVTRLVSAALGEGKDERVRGIVKASLLYSFIFGSFATPVLLTFSKYFSLTVIADKRAEISIRILALSLIPISFSSVFSGYFIGVKRVSRNAAVQVLAQIFKAVLSVVLILRFAFRGVESGVAVLSVCITATELIVFFVALFEFMIDKERYPKSSLSPEFSAVCRIALPLAVSSYVRSALLSLEHMLIPKCLRRHGESHTDSLSSYGILHGMALPVLLYPMSPLSSFAGLLVPEFSESEAAGDKKRIERIAAEAFNTTMAYAACAMVFIITFSEKIGYAVYNSYEAGSYIFCMATVIPIMYLDHVTDSMLKGIGEQVYAMWVNISDSLLSIILVLILLPKIGILGYAIVIIVMEGYNFLFSFFRLRRKIKFKIQIFKSGLLPLACAVFAANVASRAFENSGKLVNSGFLALEIVFAVCLFLGTYLFLSLICDGRIKKRA
jgi:stage V sporulation protein B